MRHPAPGSGLGCVLCSLPLAWTRYHVWLMGSRTQTEARGVFMQHVRRRWSAAFWRSWRALMHARLPCIGAPSPSTGGARMTPCGSVRGPGICGGAAFRKMGV